jgi:hypothetical protein
MTAKWEEVFSVRCRPRPSPPVGAPHRAALVETELAERGEMRARHLASAGWREWCRRGSIRTTKRNDLLDLRERQSEPARACEGKQSEHVRWVAAVAGRRASRRRQNPALLVETKCLAAKPLRFATSPPSSPSPPIDCGETRPPGAKSGDFGRRCDRLVRRVAADVTTTRLAWLDPAYTQSASLGR